MTPLISLLVSLIFATLLIVVMDRYFTRQTVRSWLGLSHSITGWKTLFDVFEHKLAYRRKDVETSLMRAGIYNARIAVFYFPAKIAVAVILVSLTFLFSDELGYETFSEQLPLAFAALVSVILVPDLWLQKRQKKRIRKVSSELPYVIDLMAVCIQTGMTIESAIAYLGEELKSFDKDLAYVMRRLDSVSRVTGMTRALDELLEHFPTNQMQSFVYTISQSLQYGSSIYSVLTTLSASIREIEMLELEERVGKLSAKMSVPLILFIMFPIVILITAPGIMRMLSNV
ncbi:hypothetical protein GZ77_07505 [Endozoicomonas montiporae]|uniref:Type II secretion system protein GspF domain-containing protein n=2 Tax=Endozoicomonas montiporae TaxID=1027273 RepID=A0A081N730_9GAMM|nr:type II secretion system F family protein [Endozoicomonas montiporae]AMO55930.1 tight adherence protein C [Endozoicomonas montiporae CL-33]KEQ14253.1 hypothetical protein GZ77_07505 [Endozoicomonas montiporae]